MIFLNYIKFKHGNLKRGERCLFRGMPAVYMGTYVEDKHTVYMLRVDSIESTEGIMQITECIVQCMDRKEITCIKQQEPVIEG